MIFRENDAYIYSYMYTQNTRYECSVEASGTRLGLDNYNLNSKL